MPLRILLLSLLLLTACTAEVESPDRSRVSDPGPAPTDTTWGEVFFDDFNTGELDRSVWNVRGPDLWVNREEQVYIDSSWTVAVNEGTDDADGVLSLTARYAPGWEAPRDRVEDFVSGRINTRDRFDFQYGRAEARIRLPDTRGMWPAFWMLGYGRWPGSGEIDIMEYVGEKDWTAVAVHGPGYSGDAAPVDNFYFPEGEDATDWHVYAVDWTADAMHFYIDEHLVYRIGRPLVTFFGEWRFDNPKYLILNTAVGGMYPYKINGIEEPYLGLPQATADLIKESGLAMEVDWVRVTRDPERHGVRASVRD